MKSYQVTRKRQVTIPKRIANSLDIKPGDSVVFEESGDTVTIKKVSEVQSSSEEVRSVIEEFVGDVKKIKLCIKEAESALIEDISGHIASQ